MHVEGETSQSSDYFDPQVGITFRAFVFLLLENVAVTIQRKSIDADEKVELTVYIVVCANPKFYSDRENFIKNYFLARNYESLSRFFSIFLFLFSVNNYNAYISFGLLGSLRKSNVDSLVFLFVVQRLQSLLFEKQICIQEIQLDYPLLHAINAFDKIL